jgi:hypothetical protein
MLYSLDLQANERTAHRSDQGSFGIVSFSRVDEHLLRALQINTAIAVTDGSYFSNYAAAAIIIEGGDSKG